MSGNEIFFEDEYDAKTYKVCVRNPSVSLSSILVLGKRVPLRRMVVQ